MEREQVFLLPGEMTYKRTPTRISTLLGSCVAVCLHDTRNLWGGMNHYMLPHRQSSDLSGGKFGDLAIQGLIDVALRVGSRKSDLVASVFGGGKVTGHLDASALAGMNDVGSRNIEMARVLLREQGIPVTRHDVGGNHGRKIHLESDTHRVELRQIARLSSNVIVDGRRQEFHQRAIRVLVIDDSPTVCSIMRSAISSAPDLEVIGEAKDPYEARELILELDPDILCLDIIMPRMDGLTFLRKIMRYKPIPTVIVSTIAQQGSAMRRNVLAAGAVSVVDKNELEIYRGSAVIQQVLLPKLRHAATRSVARLTE